MYFLALISQIWRNIAGMKVVDCLVLSFVIIINILLIIITINTINFFYIRMDYKLFSEGGSVIPLSKILLTFWTYTFNKIEEVENGIKF